MAGKAHLIVQKLLETLNSLLNLAEVNIIHLDQSAECFAEVRTALNEAQGSLFTVF